MDSVYDSMSRGKDRFLSFGERERYPWELIAYNGVFDIHSFTDTLLQSAEAGWEQLGKHTGGFGRGSQLGIPSAGYDLYNN